MVADAIRSGWILDNMPNPDTDIDLSLDRYIYYKKYGTLPSSRKRSGDEEKMRHISRFFQKLISPNFVIFFESSHFFVCRGRTASNSDDSGNESRCERASRSSSLPKARKPSPTRRSNSRTPVQKTSRQSVWANYNDEDDEDMSGNDEVRPR